MTSVYFHQKSSHRERQRDTYKIGKTLIRAYSSLAESGNSDMNLHIEKSSQSRFSKLVGFLIRTVPIINFRRIAPGKKVDFIYTWGDIPLGGDTPYIIEIDNPSILTLYNAFALKIYTPIIRYFLTQDRCHKIVCISEACREVFIGQFGESIRPKTVVLYPYVEKKEAKIKTEKTVKYAHIALRKIGKGVRETVEAFSKTKGDHLELHMIGWKDTQLEEKYSSDSRIHFHGPLERKRVLDMLDEFDILIFPTVYESLGMVALEALSAGLGIITTDTFALREFVHHDKNGYLIENPYLKKEKVGNAYLVNPTHITAEDMYRKYNLSEESFDQKFSEEIQKAIELSKEKVQEWKEESKHIFELQYQESVWKKNFISLFQ